MFCVKLFNNNFVSIPKEKNALFIQAEQLKGGESSSQFRWFTIAKIELQFLIFFVLILGLRLQRYSTNTKRCPPKKLFGNSEFCSSRQNHSKPNSLESCGRPNSLEIVRPNSLENCGFGGKTKLRVSKNFFGGYLFVFVEYLCKRSPKIKTKNTKNYSSILAIVNHWNWLDNSPPLTPGFLHLEFYC